MASNAKMLLKIFSPRIVAKALATFDKSTAIIVSACWAAALVTLILAVFAVHGAVSAKKEAAEAIAIEPALPKASPTPMSPRDIQLVVERLQRQFPDLKIEIVNSAILIHTSDGSKFHQWITAISYVDTMSPDYRWFMPEFCVGACDNHELMRALVTGQKVAFVLPPPK